VLHPRLAPFQLPHPRDSCDATIAPSGVFHVGTSAANLRHDSLSIRAHLTLGRFPLRTGRIECDRYCLSQTCLSVSTSAAATITELRDGLGRGTANEPPFRVDHPAFRFSRKVPMESQARAKLLQNYKKFRRFVVTPTFLSFFQPRDISGAISGSKWVLAIPNSCFSAPLPNLFRRSRRSRAALRPDSTQPI